MLSFKSFCLIIFLGFISAGYAQQPVNQEDNRIRMRVLAADRIIVGEVTDIVKADFNPGPESEHDPDFRFAVIDVKNILKGNILVDGASQDQKLLEKILFPASPDVIWYHFTKFTVGQRGIWVIKYRPDRKEYQFPEVDFYEMTKLENIKSIIRGQ